MMKKYLLKNKNNNFLAIFFSFSTIYISIFLILNFLGKFPNICEQEAIFQSDECQYIKNVYLLSKGTYLDPLKDRLFLPMHSIFISPLILMDLGRRAVIVLNLIVSAFTVSLTYLTSRFYLSNKLSNIISIFYGFYYLKFEKDFTANTEPIATLLLLSHLFLYSKFTFTKNKYFLYSAGIIYGCLILQKPIFFYILFPLIILNIVLTFRNKKYLYIFISLLLSFSLTMPYQIFLFKNTGKFPYLSNISGETLYWMSSPFKGEYGEWNNENFNSNCLTESTKGDNCNSKYLEENHGEFIRSLRNLNMVEKNEAYTKKAIQNIKLNPIKYLRNVFSNIGRLLFNFPGSYVYQTDITLLRIIPNSIILNLIFISLIITFFNIKKIPEEMIYCLFIIFTYLLFSSLITAYSRMFIIVVPYLLIWGGYSIKTWKDS